MTAKKEVNIRQRFREKAGRQWTEETYDGIGKVLIRNMTGREQIEFSTSIKDLDDQESMVAYIIECVHDLDKKPVFNATDAEWLMEIDSPVLARLAKTIRRVCGLDIGVKESAKNSSSSQSASSRSGSQKPADD